MYQILPKGVRELCIGILVGDTQDIDEQTKEEFRGSNLVHLLAVSGAHVSYIVLGVGAIFCKIGKRTSKICTIIFLLLFMGITSFTPSVQRASIMCILMLVASLIHRKSDIYTNLALSSFIILVCNPYAILNIGFELSYAGIMGIVLFHERIKKWLYERLSFEDNQEHTFQKGKRFFDGKKLLKYGMDIVAVAISANLMIFPMMAFHFNTISVIFLLSNMLAAPFLGCIMILGFLTYFISIVSNSLATMVAIPLGYFIQLLIWITKFCSHFHFSSIMVKTPYIVEIVLYYLGIYLLFYWRFVKEKMLNFLSRVFQKYKNKREFRKSYIKTSR